MGQPIVPLQDNLKLQINLIGSIKFIHCDFLLIHFFNTKGLILWKIVELKWQEKYLSKI